MSKIEGRGRYLEPWKYAIFRGRSRRRQYWSVALFSWLIAFLAFVPGLDVPGLSPGQDLVALNTICALAALIAFVAAGVRRMHDSGRSGWWFFCPLVNVYFTLIDGEPGANRFGPDPKGRDRNATRGFDVMAVVGGLALVGILAVIALPSQLRCCKSVNDANAIGVLRALNTAQDNFLQLCNGYSADLPTLASAGNYFPPDLTGDVTVFRSGYAFTLRRSSAPGTAVVPGQLATCNGPVTSYYASAIPLQVGATGHRSYATNEQKKIYQDVTGAAIADPPVAGGNVSEIQ
jgi:uncharacterized membrane protein YhaH (DUF805 family)/Tfp pilus assembly protein PilE